MILDERGVVAFIVTLHPGILLIAVVVAAFASLPFGWLLKVSGARHAPRLLLTFFLGASLVGHVAISWLAKLRPAAVELVRIAGDDLRPAAEE